MKEVKRIAYLNRILYIGFFLFATSVLCFFMLVYHLRLKTADAQPLIDFANVKMVADNVYVLEFAPTVFWRLNIWDAVNSIIYGVLFYGLLRRSKLEAGNNWILYKMLPVSKKAVYLTELLEVIIATLIGWILVMIYNLYKAFEVNAFYLRDLQKVPTIIAVEIDKQKIVLDMCKMFPTVLLHVLLVYGLFLIWRGLTGNGVILLIGMWLSAMSVQAFDHLVNFALSDLYGYLDFRDSHLDKLAYPAVGVTCLIMIVLGFILHMKKEESKRDVFQYTWAEVLFFVFLFINFYFLAVSGLDWKIPNPILLYGCSLVVAVLLCEAIYVLLHKTWLDSAKIKKI